MAPNSNPGSRLRRLQLQLSALSKVDKAFLIALALRLAYPLIQSATRLRLPGYGLISLLFLIAAIVFLIRSFPRLLRTLLWRVRHRLVVTWVLVGVVPIVLLCLLFGQGLYILMGQLVSYMTVSEVTRQTDLIRNTAHELAWSVAHRGPSVAMPMLAETFVRETSGARNVEVGAIVRTSGSTATVPAEGAIREIPEWSKPDFAGMLKTNGRYYFGAHVMLGGASDKTEVFLYQHAPMEFFANLLPNVATVSPGSGTASSGGIDFQTSEDKKKSGFSLKLENQNDAADPDIPEIAPRRAAGGWTCPWVGWY